MCSLSRLYKSLGSLGQPPAAGQNLQDMYRNFDLIPEIVLVVKPNGELVCANRTACDCLRFSPDELAGASLSVIEPGRAFKKVLEFSMPPAEGRLFETAYLRKNDTPVPVEVKASPIQVDHQPCVLLLARDISARKQREEVQRLSIQLARHDILTPLSMVISFADLLKNADNLSPDQRTAAEMIERAGRNIHSYLNISNKIVGIEHQDYALQATEFNLLDVTNRAIFDLQKLLRMMDCAVIVNNGADGSSGAFLIKGEEALIQVMISNMLKNAVEAAPRSSDIRIHLARDGRQWSMEIHNPGVIPPEMRDCIFEKYTTAGKNKGTGLGAYSAQRIARLHGGEIDFATSLENGTTMRIAIPLAPPAP